MPLGSHRMRESRTGRCCAVSTCPPHRVHRMISGTPERLSPQVLSALFDILSCTPADLVATAAENAGVRKTASGNLPARAPAGAGREVMSRSPTPAPRPAPGPGHSRPTASMPAPTITRPARSSATAGPSSKRSRQAERSKGFQQLSAANLPQVDHAVVAPGREKLPSWRLEDVREQLHSVPAQPTRAAAVTAPVGGSVAAGRASRTGEGQRRGSSQSILSHYGSLDQVN